MKNSHSKGIMILVASVTALLLVLAIIFEFHISSESEEVKRLQQQISENEDDANVVSVKRDIGDLSASLQALDSYLIDSQSAIPFIEALEGLARSRGVVLTILQVNNEDVNVERTIEAEDGTEDTESFRSHGKLLLSVKADANWAPLMQFLILLQNLPYEVTIADMRLAATGQATTGRGWSATFNLIGITN